MSDTATLEAVAKAVHDLSESVIGMREGLVDRETVERIAQDLMDKQKAAVVEQNRNGGYKPPDEDPDGRHAGALAHVKGADRFNLLQSRNPKWLAPRVKRSAEDIAGFQEASDTLLILAAALEKDPKELGFYKSEYLPAMRAAMDTATTAEGSEYVPRELSASLIERVNLELVVAGLFPSMVMPTNPFDIPARGVSRTRQGRLAEQINDTGQTKVKTTTPATRKVTLTAVKFAGEMLTSKEMEEDSIIAILPFMQEELVDYISADIEDTIINGDTSGTHQDSDVTSSDDPRKNWTGLRKTAISGAKTDGGNANLTVAMLRTNRKNMGKYGVRPTNLAHILSMANYIQILADASVITMEKFGPMATIVTGELAKVDGSPIIVSEYVRTDMNASGVYDGATTNRSAALTVHTRGFLIGERRGMTVQLLKELYAESDQDAIVATTRKAFSPRFTAATEKVIAVTYNLAT